MMSSRMMLNTNGIPPTTDADFSFIPMQSQSYTTSFDSTSTMSIPNVDSHLHHPNTNLYDTFDLTTTTFSPFQDPASILPPTSMAMAMPPPPPLLLTSTMFPAGVSPPTGEIMYPFGGGGFLKREDVVAVDITGGGTIGLNLGRRTYFSPADVLAVDRLLTRSRLTGGGMGLAMGGVLGLGLGGVHHHHVQQPPRCQAEGCKADLTAAKHYHRRHKVCEYHAKAAAVAAGGKQQRFCQQCSRFHVLTEFDEAKRSCRKRLTEHNRRRRKPAGAQGKDSPPPKRADTCITASCNSDHHQSGASATAASKSTAISPNGSVISCLDAMDNGQTSSAAAAAPTALSLAALPPPLHDHGKDDDGGLDSMLMRQVRRGRHDYEHRRFMTSLVTTTQQQDQHDGGNGGHGGGGHMLSCSPPVSDQQNGGCNGFFEVDFI